MYAIQTTPGFVIGSQNYGEADKILSIFTRDFGLVQAVAKGIRLEKSKLRYYAQDFCFGNFSLVRGKDMWRLTSAGSQEGRVKKSEVLVQVGRLLKRLLQGEESHPELYEEILRLGEVPETLSTEYASALESLAVFRILRALGYVGDNPKLKIYLDEKPFSSETLAQATADRLLINKEINTALKASHL